MEVSMDVKEEIIYPEDTVQIFMKEEQEFEDCIDIKQEENVFFKEDFDGKDIKQDNVFVKEEFKERDISGMTYIYDEANPFEYNLIDHNEIKSENKSPKCNIAQKSNAHYSSVLDENFSSNLLKSNQEITSKIENKTGWLPKDWITIDDNSYVLFYVRGARDQTDIIKYIKTDMIKYIAKFNPLQITVNDMRIDENKARLLVGLRNSSQSENEYVVQTLNRLQGLLLCKGVAFKKDTEVMFSMKQLSSLCFKTSTVENGFKIEVFKHVNCEVKAKRKTCSNCHKIMRIVANLKSRKKDCSTTEIEQHTGDKSTSDIKIEQHQSNSGWIPKDWIKKDDNSYVLYYSGINQPEFPKFMVKFDPLQVRANNRLLDEATTRLIVGVKGIQSDEEYVLQTLKKLQGAILCKGVSYTVAKSENIENLLKKKNPVCFKTYTVENNSKIEIFKHIQCLTTAKYKNCAWCQRLRVMLLRKSRSVKKVEQPKPPPHIWINPSELGLTNKVMTTSYVNTNSIGKSSQITDESMVEKKRKHSESLCKVPDGWVNHNNSSFTLCHPGTMLVKFYVSFRPLRLIVNDVQVSSEKANFILFQTHKNVDSDCNIHETLLKLQQVNLCKGFIVRIRDHCKIGACDITAQDELCVPCQFNCPCSLELALGNKRGPRVKCYCKPQSI